jgi:hypothetical protein
LTLLLAAPAWSDQISQVKGTKALINLDGEEAEVGAEYFAVDSSGKKRALLKIKQVRSGKAVAEITKGSASAGMSLTLRGGNARRDDGPRVKDVSSEEEAPVVQEDRARRPRGWFGQFFKRGTATGVIGGLAQNSMSLTAKKGTASEELSLSANSFNVLGFYDYDLSSTWTLHGRAGIETFSAKGTASNAAVCNDSTSCEVSFTYLSGEGHIRYNFMRGKTRAYASAGAAFLIAASKSSSVSNLDTSTSTNQMLLFGGGADFSLGRGNFVPVSLEYAMFPGSSSVKATSLFIRGGYGWRF